LQGELLAKLRRLEAVALARGCDATDIGHARYMLCAALDEAVLATPWGAGSVWLQQSLLSQLHQHNWGGEQVFAILEQSCREPERHFELIELIDHCLALGFQGRFRLMGNGVTQLEELRESLARSIAGRRPERPAALAPAWTPSVASGRIRGWLPLWVVALVAVAAALIAYTIFLSQVSSEIDQVAGTIRQIDAGR
jgi:type VI secretion system protein ImpK